MAWGREIPNPAAAPMLKLSRESKSIKLDCSFCSLLDEFHFEGDSTWNALVTSN